MNGTIFDIQRFSLHDGAGIRTTVFFKGCPLRCRWCHNPESQSFAPERMIYFDKCVSCGKCREICANAFDAACAACGKCVKVCAGAARRIAGRTAAVDEIIETVVRDKAFYETSGGGLTLSGGEPLAQPEFCLALLKAAKEANIHTAIETCGFAKPEIIEAVLPFTDLFLFDIKGIDGETHIRNTGVSNDLILANAKRLMDSKANVLFRMPYIPNYNDHEIGAVRAFTEGFPLEVMPYHAIASGKYKALQRPFATAAVTPPSQEEIQRLAEEFGMIYSPSGI
ncbi:MAG: glycyl-radical enzyme activating protein [Clostridia bacterium]|nr:glycyl-radical enzyme activating protein [Clostridia bacterium]